MSMRKHFIFTLPALSSRLSSSSPLALVNGLQVKQCSPIPGSPFPEIVVSVTYFLCCVLRCVHLVDHCLAFASVPIQVLASVAVFVFKSQLSSDASVRSFSLVVHLVAVDSLGCDFPFAFPLCSDASLL